MISVVGFCSGMASEVVVSMSVMSSVIAVWLPCLMVDGQGRCRFLDASCGPDAPFQGCISGLEPNPEVWMSLLHWRDAYLSQKWGNPCPTYQLWPFSFPPENPPKWPKWGPQNEFPGITRTRAFCGNSAETLNFLEYPGPSRFRILGSPFSAF